MYAAAQAAQHSGAEGSAAASTAVGAATILGQGPAVPAGSNVVAIEPPSTTDEVEEAEEDEEEEEDRPLSMEELRQRTIKAMNRRLEGGVIKKSSMSGVRRR